MIGRKSKILVISLIVLMLFNVFAGTVYADPWLSSNPNAEEDWSNAGKTNSNSSESNVTFTDYALGIVLMPLRLVGYVAAKATEWLTEGLFGIEGETITPETILFNKVALTNINFFEEADANNTFASGLRKNISTWYAVMFGIAIIASLCTLLYMAIRMAITNIAKEKAEYKRMFFDWLIGFVLIFVLHFIIIFVITGNNMIVDILAQTITNDSGALTDYVEVVEDNVFKLNVDISINIAALCIYIVLVFLTLGFVIMYMKRLIVTAFLIIIAPLITVTYAIDKAKDKESQALNSWLKEFVWTVLIQVFHCLIYVVFVTIAFTTMNQANMGSAILAIMCMLFITKAEDIVKKIFGIQADNVGKMSGALALAAASTMNLGKVGGNMAAKATNKMIKPPATKPNAGQTATTSDKNSNDVSGSNSRTVNNSTLENGKADNKQDKSLLQRTVDRLDSPAVRAKREQFANFMDNTTSGKSLKFLGKAAKTYGKYSYRGGMMLFGGMGAATHADGDAGKVVAGAMAASAFGDNVAGGVKRAAGAVTGGAKSLVNKGREQNAEVAKINLNDSYQKLKNETSLSDDEISKRAAELLAIDLKSEAAKQLSDAERIFASNLQMMEVRMGRMGEDTSIKQVLSKIDMLDEKKDNNENKTEK